MQELGVRLHRQLVLDQRFDFLSKTGDPLHYAFDSRARFGGIEYDQFPTRPK
jgi:hypothetical protein